MIQAKVYELQSPRLDRVEELLRSSGPCITILLPPYRPGEPGKSRAGLLKTDLQELAGQLEALGIPEQVSGDVVKPLKELTEDEASSAGSHFGRIIFRSRDAFEQFSLMKPVKAQMTVGNYFQIRPALDELYLPPEFYLLKLSQKDVELIRCRDFRTERVKLPKGVPETMEDALAFKPPDHDLENRSSAGASTAAMRGIRFGTASGRETQYAYLADFYRMVDRGVAELLHGGNPPLILAGVDEDTAAYRAIHTYPNLLSETIHGSARDASSQQDLFEEVYSIVRADHVDRMAASLVERKERLAPARISMNLELILSAAAEGRVEKLYVNEGAQKMGFLPDAIRSARGRREEDLLNVAAVETILHGGAAFSLPANKLPDGASVAAVLRY